MPNREFQNATYLDQGFAENRPPDSYSTGQLGSVVTIKDTDGVAKRGQIVQMDSIATVSPADGTLAYWVDRSQYLVSADLTASGRGNRAGVFRAAVTITAAVGNICVVQQGGKCSTLFVDAPTAAPTTAGLICIPSATAGKADCLAAGSAASYPAIGTSAGTQDGTSKKADVILDIEPNVP